MPRHPTLAATTQTLSSGVFSALAQKARSHQGVLYPLHVGDTYRLPPLEAQLPQLAEEESHYRYGSVHGLAGLLETIQAKLRDRVGRTVAVDDIQVMSGATAGLSVVAQTILQPGDEVLLPSPYWPLIRGIIAARGAVPVEIPTFTKLLDVDFDIEKSMSTAVTERTVALYLNSPNNPTGQVLSSEQVDALATLAVRHNLWVICDEAYEELWFLEDRPDPIWDHPKLRGRVIASHTLSKSYGLAGARVGFCHGPPDVIQALRSVQTFTTYCAAPAMQALGASALRDGDRWLREARTEYGTSASRAAQALGIASPAGGTFLFLDAEPHFNPGEDVTGFLTRCLEAGVLMTPGVSSGRDYKDWVRLCFTSVPPASLDDALNRLSPIFAAPASFSK